jgi:hypothetical protein
MLSQELLRHKREIDRNIRNFRFEWVEPTIPFGMSEEKFWKEIFWAKDVDPDKAAQIFIPGMDLGFGITWELTDKYGTERRHNLVPTAARSDVLGAWLKSGTRYGTQYIGVAGADVTPTASWTPVEFVGTGVELTDSDYSEVGRHPCTWGSVASGSVDNTASRATVTAATTNVTIREVGLLSHQTKESTTGLLYSVAKLASDRILPAVSDELLIAATFAASSV